MSDPQTLAVTAKHILFILTQEQRLRPGDGMSPLTLQHDLTRHDVSPELQQQALEYALEKGWLQKGPYGEWQLTETGYAVD
jgi:hypothetical protein